MSGAIFKILNLSTGEFITNYQYNMALVNFKPTSSETETYFTRMVDITNSSIDKRWHVSPPSATDIERIALYLNLPKNALEMYTVCEGYVYDAE